MPDVGGARRAAWLAALLLAAASPAGGQGEALCRPWPGEPAPLPTVASGDPALARWSELRVAELVERAQLAEDGDPLESHRLWRRVLCFDPTNQIAWRGLDRTRVVRVYRPVASWGRSAAPRRADPWQGLAAPIAVARPAPHRPIAERRPPRREAAAPPRPRPDARQERARAQRAALERARKTLEEGEGSLRAARFEEALGRAGVARRALAALPAGADSAALQVRVEVLAATAQVALGDDAAARASFARALAANPALELDPMLTSPKVMRALEDARTGNGP
jgi:hypothetical protein